MDFIYTSQLPPARTGHGAAIDPASAAGTAVARTTPSPSRPEPIEIRERAAIVSDAQIFKLFQAGNALAKEGANLQFADFAKHVPKVKNGFENTNFATLLFAYDKSQSTAGETDFGSLAIETIRENIMGQMLQYHQDDLISFITSFVDPAKYSEALSLIGVDINAERESLAELRRPENFIDGDEADLILPEGKNARWFYDYQMGRIDEDGLELENADDIELTRYLKMYRILPSELLARSELPAENDDFIDAAWLNQEFVYTYNEIEGMDTTETDLCIRERNLKAMPRNIMRLSALTDLDLYVNKLTALPPEIGNLKALKMLNFTRNKLIALPPEIGNLKALTKLYLFDNKLTALPPEIGNLPALAELYLDANPLTTLPAEIGNLTALEYLSLNENKLTALPPEIQNLMALKWLSLHHNQLTALPPEIGNLPALEHLTLHRNQLAASEIDKIKSLFAGVNFHID